ncbi:MAG TPA: HEAT repeat domain-containing protein [Elusimicrobiales bacterium]|nr:HEAT repeat domain-containing protein [Elusimicrobiales bacterium]
MSVDARESARETAYKTLALRLLAYERFAVQLYGIYELSKESAFAFVDSLSGDPDPHVRAYLAGGLAHMPTPESAGILLDLWKDADEDVRRESLRGLMNFHDKDSFSGVFSEELRLRIKEVVEREKQGGEWVL